MTNYRNNKSVLNALQWYGESNLDVSEEECQIFVEWQEKGKHKELIERENRFGGKKYPGLYCLLHGWGLMGIETKEFMKLTDSEYMINGLLNLYLSADSFSYPRILLLLDIYKKKNYHIPHMFDEELEDIGIDTLNHSYTPKELSKLDFMLQVELKEIEARLLSEIEKDAFWASSSAPCKKCGRTQKQIKEQGHINYLCKK